MKKKINPPDNFRGMWIENKKQYWVYGKGYYREWTGNIVYDKDGKKIGTMPEVKNKLKKLLEG